MKPGNKGAILENTPFNLNSNQGFKSILLVSVIQPCIGHRADIYRRAKIPIDNGWFITSWPNFKTFIPLHLVACPFQKKKNSLDGQIEGDGGSIKFMLWAHKLNENSHSNCPQVLVDNQLH